MIGDSAGVGLSEGTGVCACHKGTMLKGMASHLLPSTRPHNACVRVWVSVYVCGRVIVCVCVSGSLGRVVRVGVCVLAYVCVGGVRGGVCPVGVCVVCLCVCCVWGGLLWCV